LQGEESYGGAFDAAQQPPPPPDWDGITALEAKRLPPPPPGYVDQAEAERLANMPERTPEEDAKEVAAQLQEWRAANQRKASLMHTQVRIAKSAGSQ
jgi:hypothetical protein